MNIAPSHADLICITLLIPVNNIVKIIHMEEHEIARHFSEMGRRIKLRRKELGITQEKLAEMLGVSPNHISGVETGVQNPSFGFFVDLCEILRVTPDYLLLGSMHADSVSADIIDGLRLCSPEDVEMLRKMVEFLIERNQKKLNADNYLWNHDNHFS